MKATTTTIAIAVMTIMCLLGLVAASDDDCRPGTFVATYYEDPSITSCEPCPLGSFSIEHNAESCDPCGIDETTEGVGSTACVLESTLIVEAA